MTIKVLMQPHLYQFKTEESGIRRVVEAYFKHLPDYGIELVLPDTKHYDLKAVHAGMTGEDCDICHCHGLYWSEDYPASKWEWFINAKVVDAIRHSKETTVPSAWVAETFQRDMRFTPHIIPHGIDWDAWQGDSDEGNYVLWNKNRPSDACDPTPLVKLAGKFERGRFVTTFLPPNTPAMINVSSIGLIPHDEMKKLVKGAMVYLSVVKETFGIGVLEAMAAGVPVLGWSNGGNVDLIEHGVNGYLAELGNYDDLEEGLNYCIKHRSDLGANGREMAREYTWERAVEQVAGVYKLAMEPDPPTVGIVIPFFNKSEGEVKRAIESATNQTHNHITSIIVVDDGSDDVSVASRAVDECAARLHRVRLISQQNQGVAHARNNGIAGSDSKYICCLDADDAIEPEFIERCVNALEADSSLGIAYTALQWIKPDGSTGISEWPGDFDFDQQLKRKNQVPTCCVFRRKMWERLGGYRQRYAPKGAGAEDAEFWLRAGAYGWGGKQVTKKPLFVYSWMSGLTSKDYGEVDWTSWHPWAGEGADGRHPFASVATSETNNSHPVRQYDEPLVSVVIPVGPGHEEEVIGALDSLEAQTFRKWEAIVVWDNPASHKELETAYPYIKIVHLMFIEKGYGAGYARNRGAEIARSPFLVFLDADDALRPTCLDKMVRTWHATKSIVYSDYVGIAYVDDPGQLAVDLQNNLYTHDEKTGQAVIGYRAAEFDCDRAQRQPEKAQPWIWCNVTSFIPKTWHDEIGGFDESMPSWEDVDYHYRMAHQGHCYERIPEELMVYRFHTGGRRETGRKSHAELFNYMREKYQGVEMAGCRGCGSKKTASRPPARGVYTSQRNAARQKQLQVVDDSSFVIITYQHPNQGDHRVIGGAAFKSRVSDLPMLRTAGGYRFDYGYRKGAGYEQFLVHRQEVDLKPEWYTPVNESARQLAPKPESVPLPPPEAVTGAMMGPSTEAPPIEWPGAEDEIVPPPSFDLQKLPGVGPKLAEQMVGDGIRTVDDVLALGVEGLAQYQGINNIRAEMIMAALGAMA